LVHDAEIVLTICITLLGGLAIPLYCFGVVLWNALAVVVHVADDVLGIYITPLSKRQKLSEGGGVITPLIRRHAIFKISPCRPSAKQKRDDDGECGGYAAHG